MGFSRCKVRQREEVAHCVAHPFCSVAEQLLLYLRELSAREVLDETCFAACLLKFHAFKKKDVSFCLKYAYFKDMHSFSVN